MMLVILEKIPLEVAQLRMCSDCKETTKRITSTCHRRDRFKSRAVEQTTTIFMTTVPQKRRNQRCDSR